MSQAEPETFQVWDRGGVYAARAAIKASAVGIGFDETASEEIALVAHELGINLVKHAGGGVLCVSIPDSRPGIRIESLDGGPGLLDAERAIKDGETTADSLGYGLGSVHRLMDSLEIASRGTEAGTRITCERWLRDPSPAISSCPLSFGVVTRPHPQMPVNGDAFVLKRWADCALVAVIDGLGHGQFALRAARTAREYVERHYDHPLDSLLLGTNRACRSTRGVVMALARFDCADARVRFLGIGNIEARLLTLEDSTTLVCRRGVVGMNASAGAIVEHAWGPGSTLILHSDGLSTHWREKEFPGLLGSSAREASAQLFGRLSKSNDDATIVVVKAERE